MQRSIPLLALATLVLCLYAFAANNPNESYFFRRFYHRVLSTQNDISLPSKFFTIGDLYTIHYEFNSENTILTVAIKFHRPYQWFGIGFGTSMIDADLWVFEIVNNAITASDYYSKVQGTPSKDEALGGTNNLVLLGYELTDKHSLVKVQRKVDTGDQFDKVIKEQTQMVWASGTTPTITFHNGEMGFALFGGGKPINVFDLHIFTNLVVWGLLADFGIIIARLMRGKTIKLGSLHISAQVMHIILMSIVLLASIGVAFVMLIHQGFVKGPPFALTIHAFNGLIVLTLMFLTMISGIYNYMNLRGWCKERSRTVINAKQNHRRIGWVVYTLTKVSMLTGGIIHQVDTITHLVIINIIFTIIAHATVQFYITRAFANANKPSLSLVDHKPSLLQPNPQYQLLLKALNDGTPRSKLLNYFPDLLWVMLGNKVYDLTHFTHPGGNYLIQTCAGREVGRYFYGNYALEGTKMKPHNHSALTIEQMSQYLIGEIVEYDSVLQYQTSRKSSDADDSFLVSGSSEVWKVYSIKPLTPSTSMILFKPKNSELVVKPLSTSVGSIGRSFRVSFNKDSSAGRLYTTALSLIPTNVAIRESLYKFFNQIIAEEDPVNSTLQPEVNISYLKAQDTLPFFIKNYSSVKKGLSKAIHSLDIAGSDNNFRVHGPLGRGLELTENSSGTHCIIAAGTGILPFIDLLNMFLLRNMYVIIKQKAGVKQAEKINLFGLHLDGMLEDMQIKLVCSFAYEKEVIGLDIIEKLAEISDIYNTSNFNVIMRGHNGKYMKHVKTRFTREFLEQEVGTKHDKYYVVGPPDMNSQVTKDLELMGIDKKKIHLV